LPAEHRDDNACHRSKPSPPAPGAFMSLLESLAYIQVTVIIDETRYNEFQHTNKY
jgi:hypothetical protein